MSSAGSKLAAMTSAKFSMIDETESGAPFFNTTFKSMKAEVESPDSVRMLVDVVVPGLGFATIEIVAIGEEAYMKFFQGAPWAPLPIDQAPFNFKELGITLSELLPKMKNASLLGRETIGGAQTIRIDGEMVSEDLSNLITSTGPGHAIALTLWINEADHILRQLRITGRLFDDDEPQTQRLIGIEGYNAPVDIRLPELAAGS